MYNTRFIHRFPVAVLLAGAVMVLNGCEKDTVAPEEQAIRYLTGTGNRYWHIKDIYVNGTRTTLTASQAQYTKTYTRKPFEDEKVGSFTDSDGMGGNWRLNSPSQLTEIITNGPIRNDTIVNTLNKLSANEIDMTYTGTNGDKVRLVYFGY